MNILLADDHAMLRAGLKAILEEEFPGARVGETASCPELLDELRSKRHWDVLVLDIAMDGQDSLHVLPEIRALRPRMPVIVLSMYGERQFVIRALTQGASAYLTKGRSPDELLRAIRAALEGRRYLGEATAQQLADHLAGGATESPHELLSPREHEIFLALASARTVTEIAADLGLSAKTVSTYRKRILEKMDLRSNADLMQYAIRRGLTR